MSLTPSVNEVWCLCKGDFKFHFLFTVHGYDAS